LNHEVGTTGLLEFQMGLDTPTCTVGVSAEGVVTVNPSNESGMERIVSHLIEVHDAKRLALVCGPENNEEAKSRERAFRTALARHQLVVEERLVLRGDFSFESGASAVATIAGLSSSMLTDLDAIVASNDRMAIGVMQALQERGITAPGDISVVGFDDIAEAELTHPSLSTVRQSMPRLGKEAMRLVLSQVQLGIPGESQVLDVELVLRRSCGCSGLTQTEHTLQAAPVWNLGGGLLFNRERIQLELTRMSHGSLAAAGRGWEQRLFHGVVDALQKGDDHAFLGTVQALAERLLPGASELKLLDEVMRVLRKQIVPLFDDASKMERNRLEELIHTARTLLFEMSQRALHNDRIGLLRWNHSVAAICNTISNAADYIGLKDAIRISLPLLGIKGAFVALYDALDAQQAKLLCAFDSETDLTRFEGRSFVRRNLLPTELAAAGGQHGRSYTVQPLVRRGQMLGHLLLELELKSLSVTGSVATAITGGLDRAALTGSPLPWA
jgi:hypothetical protein